MIPKRLYSLVMRNAYAVGGYDAGQQIFTFYPNARTIFPVLRTPPEILPDSPAGSWGLAWYLGRMLDGRPRFAVRDDILLNSKVAWHESGHALEEELIYRLAAQLGLSFEQAENELRSRYWTWRGFPGTWWDAYLDALSKGTSGGWAFLPGESIAESISAAVGGYVESEWTMTFGKDLALLGVVGGAYSPAAGGIWARQFWLERMAEVDMDEQLVRSIAREEANAAAERVIALEIEEGWKPFKDAFNDHTHLYVKDTTAGSLEVETSAPKVKLGNE